MMKGNRYVFGGVIAILVVAMAFHYSRSPASLASKNIPPGKTPPGDSAVTSIPDQSNQAPKVVSLPAPKNLPGQPALNPPDFADLATSDRPPLADELGSAHSSPSREPAIILEVLDAYRRSFGAYPAGENNRQFVNALLGANAQKLPFIPRDHPRLNGDGEIIDAWGTPFFFHLISQASIEVRSAGPDRILFTNDDLIARTATSRLPEL